MSAEHHREHQERHEQADNELETARRKQLEALSRHAESGTEDAKERAEAAREVIHGHEAAAEPEPTPEPTAPKPHLPFIDHQLNYSETMRSVQRRLTPVSRAFSKIIHAPAIEKTSEALESTLARPSVTLGATLTALIVGSLFYLTAYHYGYMLSGSELLFSFIVGALIGIVVEGAWRVMVRH